MKLFHISAVILLSTMIASCSGNSSKHSSTNDSADSISQTATVSLEALENDTNETDAIKRTIMLAYFDPTLTPESEHVYSKAMLNQFNKLGFKNEVKRTDLMSDDFKKTWNQFNQLDPDAIMEFLDWDLFYCGQDIYELTVTIEKISFESQNQATANLKVVNSDQISPIAIKLTKNTADEWKINDITWKNGNEFVKQPMKNYTAGLLKN